METWKDIEGFEDFYQVSDLGRVRSLDRQIEYQSRGGYTVTYLRKGQVLKPMKTGTSAYLQVHLRKNNTTFANTIHRLVAFAFLGLPPTGMNQTNHQDGNKTNNRLENLEWCTASMNLWHAYHVLKIPQRGGARGEQSGTAKLTEEQVKEIRALYATGLYTQVTLSKLFPVNSQNINHIVTRKSWKHI